MDPRNHLDELTKEIAQRSSVTLNFDAEGYAAIEHESGVRVLFHAIPGYDILRINTVLGEISAPDRDAFLTDLLAMNGQPELFGRAFFALNGDKSHVLLVMREKITDLNYDKVSEMTRLIIAATNLAMAPFSACQEPGKNFVDEFAATVMGITPESSAPSIFEEGETVFRG